MNVIQKYRDYKLAQSERAIARHKLNSARIEISSSMDMLAYNERMYGGILPRCINLVALGFDRKPVFQTCKFFDNGIDCLECKNCIYYGKRKYYMKSEKEYKLAQQSVRVARRALINEIKNIFTLGR